MFNNIYDFIQDNKFRLIFFKDCVHIINYNNVISLKDNVCIINCNDFNIKIIGSKLVLKKLLDDEILLIGNINNIEVINE